MDFFQLNLQLGDMNIWDKVIRNGRNKTCGR